MVINTFYMCFLSLPVNTWRTGPTMVWRKLHGYKYFLQVFSKFASEHMENWPHNGMAEEQDVYNTANLPPTSVNVDEHFHHSSGVVDNYIDPTPTPTAGSTESFKPDKQRIAVVQSSPSALSQQLEQELLDIRL